MVNASGTLYFLEHDVEKNNEAMKLLTVSRIAFVVEAIKSNLVDKVLERLHVSSLPSFIREDPPMKLDGLDEIRARRANQAGRVLIGLSQFDDD